MDVNTLLRISEEVFDSFNPDSYVIRQLSGDLCVCHDSRCVTDEDIQRAVMKYHDMNEHSDVEWVECVSEVEDDVRKVSPVRAPTSETSVDIIDLDNEDVIDLSGVDDEDLNDFSFSDSKSDGFVRNDAAAQWKQILGRKRKRNISSPLVTFGTVITPALEVFEEDPEIAAERKKRRELLEIQKQNNLSIQLSALTTASVKSLLPSYVSNIKQVHGTTRPLEYVRDRHNTFTSPSGSGDLIEPLSPLFSITWHDIVHLFSRLFNGDGRWNGVLPLLCRSGLSETFNRLVQSGNRVSVDRTLESHPYEVLEDPDSRFSMIFGGETSMYEIQCELRSFLMILINSGLQTCDGQDARSPDLFDVPQNATVSSPLLPVVERGQWNSSHCLKEYSALISIIDLVLEFHLHVFVRSVGSDILQKNPGHESSSEITFDTLTSAMKRLSGWVDKGLLQRLYRKSPSGEKSVSHTPNISELSSCTSGHKMWDSTFEALINSSHEMELVSNFPQFQVLLSATSSFSVGHLKNLSLLLLTSLLVEWIHPSFLDNAQSPSALDNVSMNLCVEIMLYLCNFIPTSGQSTDSPFLYLILLYLTSLPE